MNDWSVHFFTIVARNYLAYAYVLGKSLLRYHPEARFSIFVMDDIDGTYSADIQRHGFHALGPKEIAIADYTAFVFKYTVTEASTAVKPFLFQALLAAGADRVIYLDPDILCYRRLTELLDALNTSSIVLTPHSTSPVGEGRYPDDFIFLAFGAYNLGFIAVSRGAVADRFLEWWSKRLHDWCLDLKESNLFVDQKWMDLVPAYFEEVRILKSLAYNIAYWNFHERSLCRTGETLEVLPSKEAVAFIHFSGIDTDNLDSVTRYTSKSPFDLFGQRAKKNFTLTERPDLFAPFHEYASLLAQASHARYAALPYAYANYENGEKISPLERLLFWGQPHSPNVSASPFAVSPGSFHHLCRTSGIGKLDSLLAKPGSGETPQNFEFLAGLIRFALRLLMRRVGPDRYAKFAKYLRQQLLPVHQRFLLKE